MYKIMKEVKKHIQNWEDNHIAVILSELGAIAGEKIVINRYEHKNIVKEG